MSAEFFKMGHPVFYTGFHDVVRCYRNGGCVAIGVRGPRIEPAHSADQRNDRWPLRDDIRGRCNVAVEGKSIEDDLLMDRNSFIHYT